MVRVAVDATGAVRVVGVGGTAAGGQSLVEPSCVTQIMRAAQHWRYRPFEANGHLIARQFDERVEVLPPELWRDDQRRFPDVPDLTNGRIILLRTGCYGTCPSYRVELRGDGTVVFQGFQYVDGLGEHRSRITPSAFAGLLDHFRRARFFDLRDRYETEITDGATYRLTVEAGGQRASVVDYYGLYAGMPLVVRGLQDEVDRVANTQQWIGRGGHE